MNDLATLWTCMTQSLYGLYVCRGVFLCLFLCVPWCSVFIKCWTAEMAVCVCVRVRVRVRLLLSRARHSGDSVFYCAVDSLCAQSRLLAASICSVGPEKGICSTLPYPLSLSPSSPASSSASVSHSPSQPCLPLFFVALSLNHPPYRFLSILSVHPLSAPLTLCISLSLSLSLSRRPQQYLSLDVCVPACLSRSVPPSAFYLSVCPSVFQSVWLSVCLNVFPSLCLSLESVVCLFVNPSHYL